jgi:hypothetical protein
MVTHVEVPIKLAIQVLARELVRFTIIGKDENRDIRCT